MTAKKTATKKAAAPPPRPSKKQLLMNREAILKELETKGSYRSGPSRKDLFIRPTKEGELKVFVLPDIKPRGREGNPHPGVRATGHWLEGTRDDGTTYPVNPTCLNALFEEEPYVVERLVEQKAGPFAAVKKFEIGMVPERVNMSCVPCQVIETFGEDALPRDKFDNPRMSPRSVIMLQGVTEDEELKILCLTPPTYTAFLNNILDPDILEPGQFEESGVMAKFEPIVDAQGKVKGYSVKLLPNVKCPLADWKDKMLDLELMGFNFMPYDEQVQLMYQNLQGTFTAELSEMFKGVEPPQVKKVAPPTRPSRVKAAR